MLTGRLPYGTHVSRLRTRADLRRLVYVSARDEQRHIPDWVDDALRRAVHPLPHKRYDALSEFMQDLRQPGPGLPRWPRSTRRCCSATRCASGRACACCWRWR